MDLQVQPVSLPPAAANPRRQLVIVAALLLPATVLYVATLTLISYRWLGDPEAMFQENAPATWLSVVFLLPDAAGLPGRPVAAGGSGGEAAWGFWMHVCFAFLIAALDEWLRIHEFIDKLRRGLTGTDVDHPVWGNIDYIPLMLYGIYLLLLGWRWRSRLVQIRGLILFGTLGGVGFAGMIVADGLRANGWLEDGQKLVAEACFIVSLLAALWHRPAVDLVTT